MSPPTRVKSRRQIVWQGFSSSQEQGGALAATSAICLVFSSLSFSLFLPREGATYSCRIVGLADVAADIDLRQKAQSDSNFLSNSRRSLPVNTQDNAPSGIDFSEPVFSKAEVAHTPNVTAGFFFFPYVGASPGM